MSVRGSSTSDSACNLQACVQLWPCTEPCSLDLSLYHFTPCITDSVFSSPDLMVLLLQAHWSSAPLNSTCCSCHNRDVIHCYLRFFLTENPNSASPRLLTLFPFPLIPLCIYWYKAYFGSHHFHNSFDIAQISWANLTLHRASCLQWGIWGLLFLVS